MITAVIIAKNEAKNLPECLKTLAFCSEILVVDDNSGDQTATIAKKNGARVITADIHNDFATLRNLALDHVTTPWILYVDADERVTPQLAQEILLSVSDSDLDGYYLSRTDSLWGYLLHHGDTGRVRLLRLGRSGVGKWTGRVHETWQIPGSIGTLVNPLIHYPHRDLPDFLNKLNYYSGIRARELRDQKVRSGIFSIVSYTLGKFVSLWIFKSGFRDGTVGLIHAVCMSFYSFLVRSKLYLLSKGITDDE